MIPKFLAWPTGWMMVLFIQTGTREEGPGLEREMRLDWILDFLNFELARQTAGNMALELREICALHKEHRVELRGTKTFMRHAERGTVCT